MPRHRRGTIPPDLKAEAAALAADLDTVIAARASTQDLQESMVKLSYAVAGNHRIVPKEARLKMAVFHEALDYPAVVLRNGFAEAIKRFKWFPAVAELREIMDPIHRRLLACRDEAHDLATHELPPPEPKFEPIDAEVSAEVEKLLSGFKRPARAPALESLDPARAARALKGFRRIPMLWRGETEETGENDG